MFGGGSFDGLFWDYDDLPKYFLCLCGGWDSPGGKDHGEKVGMKSCVIVRKSCGFVLRKKVGCMDIKRYITNYYQSSRKGNKIKYIVIHYTGNCGDSALGNCKYFSRPGNRPASCHYFVDDSSIYQSVEDHKAAYHVGDGRGRYGITNANSIGIEMCGNKRGKITEATRNHALFMTKVLMGRYGIPADRVVRHYDASRKNCPSAWNYENWRPWREFKALLGSGFVPTSTLGLGDRELYYKSGAPVFTGSDVEDLQKRLCYVGFAVSIDGSFGPAMRKAVTTLQERAGILCNGVFGKDSLKALERLEDMVDEKKVKEIVRPSLKGEGDSESHWAFRDVKELNDKLHSQGSKGISELRLDDPLTRGEFFHVLNEVLKK